MLFIQNICIIYQKDVRYANFANSRRALKFLPVNFKGAVSGEVMYDRIYVSQKSGVEQQLKRSEKINFFGDEVFFTGKFQPEFFGERVYIRQCGDGYEILYTDKKQRGFIKSKFQLMNGQTGRIIYNARVSEEEAWFYVSNIFTFVCTEKEKYKQKIFYIKKPDFMFSDMKILRYNGN